VKQEVLFLISTRSDTDDDDDDDDDDDAKRNITKIDEYNIFVGSIKWATPTAKCLFLQEAKAALDTTTGKKV
jgi:hypothetical protein